LLSVLALSCASANRLAMLSDRELTSGNLDRAYEMARHAVDKEPDNPRARAVMTAAAVQIVDRWKTNIYQLAEVDTIAAARASLELRTFRGELSRYDIPVPEDEGFDAHVRTIRVGAAEIFYQRGVLALEAGEPKHAWHEFQGVREFEPGYRNVEALVQRAFEAGRTRVAILPFSDQVGVPGLSQQVAERIGVSVEGAFGAQYPFTELIATDRVMATMTVDQLSDLRRSEALRIGRLLGADRVVVGRIYGLRSNTTADHYQQTIYRHVTVRDTDGTAIEHYDEVPFSAVIRERDVAVRYEFEVLDVRSRATIDSRTDGLEAHARTVWTDFQADGECDRYRLAPGQGRHTGAESRWNASFGSWSLPGLLDRARSEKGRLHYEPRYRDEFFGDSRANPIYLAELPSENDLASSRSIRSATACSTCCAVLDSEEPGSAVAKSAKQP
jgi:hypothetical protein